MQLKTILNRLQTQPGFVYGAVRFGEAAGRLHLEVELRRRANRQPRCAGCQRARPDYDTLPPRRFEFVPLWGLAVFFVYARQRVQCPRCGVWVEAIPWAEGKQQLTTTYAWFLAAWAKRLSWTGVAQVFHTTWDHVFRSVTMAVRWGLTHRDLTRITALGIDEFARRRGHKYVTLVYQLDPECRRLLWIGPDRKARALLAFFRWLGPARTQAVRFVCSDMWKAYLRIVAKKAGHALHVLDRFHIIVHFNKAIDKVRARRCAPCRRRAAPRS